MKQIIVLLLVVALAWSTAVEGDEDRHTYSNFLEFDPQKMDLELKFDFDDQFIRGYVRHRFLALQKNIKELWLDLGNQITTSKIQIEKKNDKVLVLEGDDAKAYDKPLGKQLVLKIGSFWSEIKKGDEFFIDIWYYTTFDKSKYIVYQNETSKSGVINYFYALCKPFCRDLVPLMDTPVVKVPISLTIERPQAWTFFSSGPLINSTLSPTQGFVIDTFAEGKSIPAYALTIYGSTNVVKIHDTLDTYIVASPDIAEDIILEFRNVVQGQINAIEVYLGMDLPFDQMQIIFPPKSFPYFDMEAAYTSYISQTVLTGDGNETYNCARTVARQYFGSSIVPQNWSNIFITEGLVAFMERKIIEMTRGEEYAMTESMIGNHSLYLQMMELGFDNNFTKLVPYFYDYQDPGDYETIVPREKGYQLMKQIEKAMNSVSNKNPQVNAKDNMREFLRSFVVTYIFTKDSETLDYTEFRNFWIDWTFNHLENPSAVINQVDYTKFTIKPGMPPTTLNFDNEMYEDIRDLAEVFIELGGVARPNNWDLLLQQESEYYIVFLDYMIDNYKRINAKIYKQVEKYYALSEEQDLNLASLWFSMAIISKQSQDKYVLQEIDNYLSKVGRIDLIAPVYEAFNLTSQRNIGCQIYRKNSGWLHPLTKEYFEPLKCPLM